MGEPSTSVLSGLFTRIESQDVARDPLEDFTTEALAGAIRRDARPMVVALGQSGSFDTTSVSQQHLTVFTQRTYSVPDDEGRVDLVLLWSAPGSAVELWIEVKTGSPLSGDRQLQRYARAQRLLSARDGVDRPRLVLLSTTDIRSAGDGGDATSDLLISAHMSWQDIVEAVGAGPDSDSLWRELVLFLKEKGMTQDATFPITAREATSLDDAHRLYLKSVELLRAVNTAGTSTFPNVAKGWWTPGQIAPFVRRQFRDHGRFCLGLWGGSDVGFVFGIEGSQAGEAMYKVWLEADPKNGSARARVHALAQVGELEAAGWELKYDGWVLVVARAHTVNFATLELATAWFMERFAELEREGLFRLQQERSPAGAAPIAPVGDETV